jgi:hypothetical protein
VSQQGAGTILEEVASHRTQQEEWTDNLRRFGAQPYERGPVVLDRISAEVSECPAGSMPVDHLWGSYCLSEYDVQGFQTQGE